MTRWSPWFQHLHELQLALGSTYRGLGVYDRAEALLTDAHSIRRSMYGDQDLRTLEARLHLGRLANDVGEYGVAESSFREILEHLPTTSRDEALLNADAKYHLAWLMFNQPLSNRDPQHDAKIVEESKLLFNEVIQVRGKWLEPNDRLIGLAYVGYADACLSHRSMTEEGLLAEAHALGVFSKNSATAGLGQTLIDYQKAEQLRLAGDFEAAEIAYHRLTAVFGQHLGREHPVYILHLWNLAGLYRKFGELEKAEATISTIRGLVRHAPAVRSSPRHLDGMRQYIDALALARPDDVEDVLKETIAWASERPSLHRELLNHLEAIVARDAPSHLPPTDDIP
jgi:tetratricopeptide (TPR) repeat protein